MFGGTQYHVYHDMGSVDRRSLEADGQGSCLPWLPE